MDIQEIIQDRENGMTYKEIAVKYERSPSTVYNFFVGYFALMGVEKKRTEKRNKEIVLDFRRGIKVKDLMIKYGMCRSSISQILHSKGGVDAV